MAVFQYEREQLLPVNIDTVWDFISSPKNLSVITPDYMGFNITSKDLPKKMYEGQIISYRVKPMLNIGVTWVTEIKHVSERRYFVDSQLKGPYKLWHHEHKLTETADGVLMKDIVTYIPPFGIIGSIANALFIKHKIKQIFDYREQKLIDIFGVSS